MLNTVMSRLGRLFEIKRYYGFLKYEPSSFGTYLWESSLIGCVSWIPGLIGAVIRNLVYRLIVAKVGSFAFIEAGVEMRGVGSIELGNRVIIRNRCALNGWSPCSKLQINDFAHLDSGVDIRTHTGGTIQIGRRTYIGPNVCIAGPGDVSIGEDCLIASNVGIYANNHTYSDRSVPINQQGVTARGIKVGDDCWLGSGVKILDGVTIGRGCVVGAGAVVTKDLPSYSIAVGVPATVIAHRDSNSDARAQLATLSH